MSSHERGRRGKPETEEEAQDAMLLLQLLFRRFEPLNDRLANISAVTPGSSFASDGDAAPYRRVPDQIVGLLNTATDHLHAVQISVEDSDGKILPFALFTLIRSVYECAGTGLWILDQEQRDERLLRSMRLTFEDRRQQNVVRLEQGEADPGFIRVEAKLREQLSDWPAMANRSLSKNTSVTSRLKEIGHLFPKMTPSPLTSWRIASGIAHGNAFMSLMVLEHEQLDDYVDGAASFRLTSSVSVIALFYRNALLMTESLFELYDTHNQAP